eukprot:6147791-Prymnesium_polylepis.1
MAAAATGWQAAAVAHASVLAALVRAMLVDDGGCDAFGSRAAAPVMELAATLHVEPGQQEQQ